MAFDPDNILNSILASIHKKRKRFHDDYPIEDAS